MPVDRDHLESESPLLPVKAGTNAHALLSVLVQHPDLGFTAAELADLTDVPSGSVGKTLARLEERGLVEQLEGHWVVADDTVGDHVGSLLSLDAVEERYGDDFYGRSDDWVAELPDLGEDE